VWRLETWHAENLAAVVIAIFIVVTLPHHLLIERLSSRTEQSVNSNSVKGRCYG
jgi:hypothetical protein